MYYLYGIENKSWAVKDFGDLTDLQKEKATVKLDKLPTKPNNKENHNTILFIDPKNLKVKYIQEPSVVHFPEEGWAKWDEATTSWKIIDDEIS